VKARRHTVEIEGFGPVTIKGLSCKQEEAIRREAQGDHILATGLILRRGLIDKQVRSMTDEDFGGEHERNAVLARIANAIVERSWGSRSRTGAI
jgi:hypothetical protein